MDRHKNVKKLKIPFVLIDTTMGMNIISFIVNVTNVVPTLSYSSCAFFSYFTAAIKYEKY